MLDIKNKQAIIAAIEDGSITDELQERYMLKIVSKAQRVELIKLQDQFIEVILIHHQYQLRVLSIKYLSEEEALQLIKEYKESKSSFIKHCVEYRRSLLEKALELSEKYGIRYEIILVFDNNETAINAFVQSINQAMYTPYSAGAIMGEEKTFKAEIEQLGIEIGNADPKVLAPYIADCLCRGELII